MPFRLLFSISILTVLFAIPATASSMARGCDEVRFRESVLPTTAAHKYYLSVTNVTYNQKVGALQMISRFFIDDLEDVLNERLNKKLTLGNPNELDSLTPILNSYLGKRLVAKVNGKQVTPQVLGAEYDNDQMVIYIELPADQQPKTIEMSYKALFELFPDQKNLVHFKIDGKRKSLLNSMDTPVEQVKF